MGFQERLDHDRQRQADAARAEAEATERARKARLQEKERARKAGLALLPEVWEAVKALRRDRARSEALLMSPPYRYDGPRIYRGANILGPITGQVRRSEKRRFLPGTAVRTETGFLGWWTRSAPFEFEIPLEGPPQAGAFIGPTQSPPASLEVFVQRGIYEYSETDEFGPHTVVDVSVDFGLRYLIGKIEEHLLRL